MGERPPTATNLTLTQEAGGYVLRWQGPSDPTKILYYTVEIKKDGQGEKWRPLTDHRIDTEEASYMSKLNNCDKYNYTSTLIVAQNSVKGESRCITVLIPEIHNRTLR